MMAAPIRPTTRDVTDTIDALLNEGIAPGAIRSTLRTVLPWPPSVVVDHVKERTDIWLSNAEADMKAYAVEENWFRLGILLAKYQKVTAK
jgi:hypothetical protein